VAPPRGRGLTAARCTGRGPDTLIGGRDCVPGLACWGPVASCATAAVVLRRRAASRVEKAHTRRERPRQRPLKLTGNTSRLEGDKRPVTAILADEVRFRPYADCTTTGLRFARTPRPTRSRVTVAGGRSPGSRVAVSGRLPRSIAPSGTMAGHSPLTVAGAAAALWASLSRARTAFPFDPLREPPLAIWTEPRNRSSGEMASRCARSNDHK
jgi:hypothetical protein